MDVLAESGLAGSALLEKDKSSLGEGLALLMDELAYGVVLITLEAGMLHANQSARHELERRRVLVVRKGMLLARMPDDGSTLQDALTKAGEGKRSLINLIGVEQANLTLAVLPLKSQPGTQARVALMFARACVCDSLMLSFFARRHGLTATEEHVLGILCQGYSAPEVAQQMKVAVSTARSHVRSLCAKTRSSGVRELVNKVTVLPPVAPAFWHQPMH